MNKQTHEHQVFTGSVTEFPAIKQQRISPFDDELGVFSDEVLVAEYEQGACIGRSDARQADVGCPLGDVP